MARSPKAPKSKSASSAHSVFDPLNSALKASFLKRARRNEEAREAKVEGRVRVKKKSAKQSARSAAQTPVSPLAPKSLPEMGPLAGVSLATARTGNKYRGRDDLLLCLFDPGTTVAGVFTKSTMVSAPVEWCRTNLERVEDSEARALIVNAGNANAFTGRAGADTTKTVGGLLADLLDCRRRDVFQASTGVIGEPLDAEILTTHVETMIEGAKPGGFTDAARAIMTTDTFAKAATRTALIDGVEVSIHGIAKGSGMIAPDMATMLSFIFTDAAIPAPVLQTLLMLTVRETFNTVTVDSDTSTSDTVLMFATGAGVGHPAINRPGDARLSDFREKLMEVLEELAKLVVRDGEGASKFVTLQVTGAESPRSARAVAFAIANSPLVKTAIAGEDPNWGRIVMAVGKAGEPADRDRLAIRLGGMPVACKGARDPDYDEEALSQYMKAQEIEIEVDLGVGKGEARVWTCDLTHGYISINSDYRS